MTNAAVQKEAFPLAGGLTTVNVQTLAKLSMLSLTKPDMETAPVISGQLRVSFRPAQTLSNSFGVSRSLPGRLTCRPRFDYRESFELADWMILFNSGESPESPNPLIISKTCNAGEDEHEQYSGSLKPENYSGSAEHYRYSGSSEYKQYLGSVVIRNGCIYENQQVKSKGKGSAENTTLCDYGFYHHEENHYLAVLQVTNCHLQNRLSLCESISPAQNLHVEIIGTQNLQLVKNYSQNSLMLNDYSNLSHEENQHLAEQHVRACETFVGQPFGASLAFLRWRRLISPLAAVTRKPAVLSPSHFNCSISSITSCGIRTVVICDFAFFAPVAITGSPYIRCMSVYAKIIIKKGLKCILLMCSVKSIGEIHLEMAKPGSVGALTGPLTTNDRLDIEVAMLNHTPTRFKFLFLAVHRSDVNAKPHRESVTAHSEQDARRSLAGQFVLSFAGRLPEVNHA